MYRDDDIHNSTSVRRKDVAMITNAGNIIILIKSPNILMSYLNPRKALILFINTSGLQIVL